jgi:dihydroflavonol-4-reductase
MTRSDPPADTPVLLTGISGFIAKRIALDLLNAGYSVRGSLRSAARADEVCDALRPRLEDASALARLSFVELDLTRDDGWARAATGACAVIHTASPFPLSQPKDESQILRPAVDGTLRALNAAEAAGVTRVVLTSSMEAVMHGKPDGHLMTEADWSDLSARTVTPYTKSKTLAERAAWDFAAVHPHLRLTVINPGLVLGEPLDRHYGSSVGIVARFLSGRDPMVPDIAFPAVDLADVSAMHVAALGRDESAGKRYIAADGYLSFPDLAQALKAAYPQRKIATRIAPRWLVALLAAFDPQVRSLRHWIGRHDRLTHAAAARDLGVGFTPAIEAALASAAFLTSRDQPG